MTEPRAGEPDEIKQPGSKSSEESIHRTGVSGSSGEQRQGATAWGSEGRADAQPGSVSASTPGFSAGTAAGSSAGVSTGSGSAAHTGNVAVQGPFTLRDLVVEASVLVMFIGSLLPTFGAGGFKINLWSGGGLYFVGVGIVFPLVVGALFAARRLAPSAKLRVGSLSLDQFASVVAVVAGAFFFLGTVASFSWGFLISLIGSVGLVAATTLAPWLPFFAAEFRDRPETAAHPVARNALAPAAKPKAVPESRSQTPSDSGRGIVSGHVAGSQGHSQVGHQPAGSAAGSNAPGPWGVMTGTGSAAAEASAGRGAAEASTGSTAGAAAAAAAGAAIAGSERTTRPLSAADERRAGESSIVAPAAGADGDTREPVAGSTTGDVDRGAQAGAARASRAGAETDPGTETGAATGTSAASASAGDRGAITGAATRSGGAADTRTTAFGTVRGRDGSDEPEHARASSIGATVDPTVNEDAAEPTYEAFWFAVGQSRSIVDERTGAHLFTIEPGSWVLALQDRGHEFLVQHTDGQVGVLRDLSNIERA